MIVFIPATLINKPVVKISIARIKRLIPDVNFLIVTPSRDDFNSLIDSDVKVMSDNDFCIISKTELASYLSPSKKHLIGWYYQQLLKYSVLNTLKNEDVLIVDADTVILGDIRKRENIFYTSNERHKAYFEHFHLLFNSNAPLKASAITNFMWFDSNKLREMLNEIESSHNDTWWKVIILTANKISSDVAFSEYETYANWCALKYGVQSEVKIHIFRRGDLLLTKSHGYEDVVNKAEKNGYFSVGFELAHSRNFCRTIFAWFLMSLSIRWW
jgi:hypothetical protein